MDAGSHSLSSQLVMARLVRATHDHGVAGIGVAMPSATGASEIMGPPDEPGDDEQERRGRGMFSAMATF
jgi:hypothetical protein